MNTKGNGQGVAAQSLATMSFDELAKLLQDRAKTMMAASNYQNAVIFGVLARRFADAAREIDTYALNEAAIANMVLEGDSTATEWAEKKLKTLSQQAQT